MDSVDLAVTVSYNKAMSSFRDKRWNNAKQHFDDVLMMQPDYWQAALILAECECKCDNVDRALKLCDEVIEAKRGSYYGYKTKAQVCCDHNRSVEGVAAAALYDYYCCLFGFWRLFL